MALGKRITNREVDGLGQDDLKALLELAKLVEEQAALVVVRMHESHMTDGEIRDLLGVSKQAVQKRSPRTAARTGRSR